MYKRQLKTRETLNQILADHCGQTLQKIEGDTDAVLAAKADKVAEWNKILAA